jgi:REP element-mobilizing transposase RayT
MTRALRIEYEGAVYHVISRGNDEQKTFLSDDDRIRFLSLLKSIRNRYALIVHAYCLMDNHYHLLLETNRANLSESMRQINGIYTQEFNRVHSRRGHLFQGRYTAIICDKDEYFLALSRYIVQNPVRAGIVNDLAHYEWSSYSETIANRQEEDSLTEPGFTLSLLSNDQQEAKKLYSDFVTDGKDENIRVNLKAGFIFGGDHFVQTINEPIEKEKRSKEIKAAQRHPSREPLSNLLSFSEKKERNRKILIAYEKHGYKMARIAEFLGIHYSTVSHIINEELAKIPSPKT